MRGGGPSLGGKISSFRRSRFAGASLIIGLVWAGSWFHRCTCTFSGGTQQAAQAPDCESSRVCPCAAVGSLSQSGGDVWHW